MDLDSAAPTPSENDAHETAKQPLLYAVFLHPLAPAGATILWLIVGFMAVLAEINFLIVIMIVIISLAVFRLGERAQGVV